MKIAHVVDSMDVGGAETLVAQMCRLQRLQGHDPRIYAIATLGPLGEQMQKEGFHVQAHMGHGLPKAQLSFYRIFKELRPDIVHLHNPTPTAYAALGARMAGVPSIVTTRHSLVAKPRRLVVELKYAIAATCCDWMVGICDATTKNLREICSARSKKIVRVYNGALPIARVAQEQWPAKSGFTLVCVGRLAPVKNHALLLDAFCIALKTRSTLRLWIVGGGGERQKLEDLADKLGIRSQVTFWGQQLDVAPFFSAADAFIMSSKSEGLPISLLQAFSVGLPAIVTDVGGMAEAVRLAQAGMVVSATDPSQMATAIVRMSETDSERKQFSVNAEETFYLRFTLQTMVDAYMELCKNTSRAQRLSGDKQLLSTSR
jgi:glycosyltransferase involved in cell wall biosynthesis